MGEDDEEGWASGAALTSPWGIRKAVKGIIRLNDTATPLSTDGTATLLMHRG